MRLCEGSGKIVINERSLEDFFTEEYTLNHLIHVYPQPYVVFLDGVVMGGGMGISAHGSDASLRIATERTQMARPETNIGLFPDVGGGWFQVTQRWTVEVEGNEKPACVAESVGRVLT